MVDIVGASFDITFDEPGRPLPRLADLLEGRVWSSVWSKAVRVVAEPLFVVGFQERPQGFLHELVAPCRNSERSHLPVRFRNFRPANRRPDIPFLSEQGDDVVDLLEAHTIHRFGGGPLRHRSGIPVNLTVGTKEELRVEQMLVDTLQGETPGPSILMDGQHRVGVTHHTYLHRLPPDSPASLRHVPGFPWLRLLRRLRRHRALAP